MITGSAAAQAAAIEARAIERKLRELGTPERAVSEQNYLKSDLEFAGTAVPDTRSVIRAWCRDRPGQTGAALTRAELTPVARALWDRPLFECRIAATVLLERCVRLLEAADIGLVEDLLRRSGTWALVDGLAANVAGSLAGRYPELGGTLDRWAADEDFWLRRSALLALLVPLRRGGGDFERFGRYADQMLAEREFFIRKAIGWVLRETAKRRPELVADWLTPRVHLASGVTVREAVKPLPAADRDRLLAAYRAARSVSRTPRG